MSSKKTRRHLDEKLKNRIVGLKQVKMTYQESFALLKKENIKTSLSIVKRISLKYER